MTQRETEEGSSGGDVKTYLNNKQLNTALICSFRLCTSLADIARFTGEMRVGHKAG